MTELSRPLKGHQKAYPCADVPEFEALRCQAIFTQALQRDSQSRDDFIARAGAIILQQVLLSRPYRRSGQHLLDRLGKQGYSNAELAQALATAWLDNASDFYVAKTKLSDRFASPFMRIILSIALSLSTLFLGFYALWHFAHKLFVSLVLFQAIIAPLLGWVLASLYYRALRRIL
jgi:hypothetical protein